MKGDECEEAVEVWCAESIVLKNSGDFYIWVDWVLYLPQFAVEEI